MPRKPDDSQNDIQFVNIDEIWPMSVSKVIALGIRNLDYDSFRELTKRVRKRGEKAGLSRSKMHSLNRQLVKAYFGKRRRVQGFISKRYLAWKMKNSRLLKALFPNREKEWLIPTKRTKETVIDIENFSFLDNPTETLKTLQCIAQNEAVCLRAAVNFNDNRIRDIGPYLVWGMMHQFMAPFMRGGDMGGSVQKVLESVGLDKYMDISLNSQNDGRDVWSFPLQERRSSGSSSQSRDKSIPTFSRIADGLVKTISDWLKIGDDPLLLSLRAKANISNMTTEVLNNAERHSDIADRDGDWVVAGFMARREEELVGTSIKSVWHDCHIAFVSVGDTISHSIDQAEDDHVSEKVQSYCNKHKKLRGRSAEVLKVVVALQDGVSRFSQKTGRSKGGVGMMDVVQFANDLGTTLNSDHQPVVAVVSGSSCILFKEPYSKGKKNADGLREQWFNNENDLDLPPESSHVIDTGIQFPGTVVSVRFSIDKSKNITEEKVVS